MSFNRPSTGQTAQHGQQFTSHSSQVAATVGQHLNSPAATGFQPVYGVPGPAQNPPNTPATSQYSPSSQHIYQIPLQGQGHTPKPKWTSAQ